MKPKNPNIEHAIRTSKVYAPGFQSSFLKPKYWLIWFSFFLLWLLTWVPWPIRSALAWPLGYLALVTSHKRRRIAEINLKMCFPQWSDQQRQKIIRQHFYMRMRSTLDIGFLFWASERRLRRRIKFKGEEHIKAVLDRGGSLIWLTCHMLALEYGAVRISLDYAGVGLVKPLKNPLANWMLQRGRRRFHALLYTREDGFRPIIKAIKNGVMFYYLPDEDLGGSESEFAPFFATTASTLATLGRLASISNAVVTPATSYYEPWTGKYVIQFYPALTSFPEPNRQQDASRMNQELEKLIRVQLPQYMWGMKLFKHQADGSNPYK